MGHSVVTFLSSGLGAPSQSESTSSVSLIVSLWKAENLTTMFNHTINNMVEKETKINEMNFTLLHPCKQHQLYHTPFHCINWLRPCLRMNCFISPLNQHHYLQACQHLNSTFLPFITNIGYTPVNASIFYLIPFSFKYWLCPCPTSELYHI